MLTQKDGKLHCREDKAKILQMWRAEPTEHPVSVYLIGKEQREHIPKYFEGLLEEDCVFCFHSTQKCVEILKNGILSNMKTKHVLIEAGVVLFCVSGKGSLRKAVMPSFSGEAFDMEYSVQKELYKC